MTLTISSDSNIYNVISLFAFLYSISSISCFFVQAKHVTRLEKRRFASQVLSSSIYHLPHNRGCAWGTISSRNSSKRIVLGASRFINRGTNMELHEPQRRWKLFAQFVTPWLLGHDFSCSPTRDISIVLTLSLILAFSHALIFFFFFFTSTLLQRL